jgi:thiopeptide-type bacteriocin biosynthesis protein
MPKSIYKPLDKAFIRLPALPIETLAQLQDVVKLTLADPRIYEAIAIASPSLAETLAEFDQLSPKRQQQAKRSLLKYLIRMSSRTTPFGLFSGIAQAGIGEHTNLPVANPSMHRHRTRLDMEWLLSFVRSLENNPAIRPHLTYTYQPIMVRVGERYYFEYRDEQGKRTTTSIIATSGVELLIQKTLGGKKYADLLGEMLATIPEATPEEMTIFIDKFINYGAICSSLRPPLTHADPARYVLEQLTPLTAARSFTKQLRALLKGIEQYDSLALGEGQATLQLLTAAVQQLHPLSTSRLPFTVDLTVGFAEKPTLQPSLAADAAKFVDVLFKLSTNDAAETALATYRQEFMERYGHDRIVPVLEVLNQEVGLGLPAHYANAGHRHGRQSNHQAKQSDHDRILFQLALETIREKRSIVQLNETTLTRLINPELKVASLPGSLDVAVHIAATSQRQLNAGNYTLVASPLGGAQPAGRTIGRFADLLGEETIRYLQDVARLEESTEAERLHAELVYQPSNAHAANVAIRPAVRQYEIVVGAAPGVAPNSTLPLDDLFIGVRGQRFYLWSANHRKEVVVGQTHMLNPMNAPSVCRFLLEVSRDTVAPLAMWSWGAAANLPMLPRVVYERLVLAPAEWKLSVQDMEQSWGQQAKKRDVPAAAEWHKTIQAWRQKWRVPRYIYLTESDNRLLLDLNQEEQAMELFYAATAHGKPRTLNLQEALPGPRQAWITGQDGHYLNECVFQLVRNSPPFTEKDDESDNSMPTSQSASQEVRTKLFGSDWLYCKLYIPPLQQDEFLANYVRQLLQAVTDRQAMEAWFFIRYADPDPHLRLRFKVADAAMLQKLLAVITAWLKHIQRLGLLRRFCIDTYDREIERYGGPEAISIAEAVFAAESGVDLQLIRVKERGALPDSNLLHIAVLTTSLILSAFELELPQQAAWIGTRQAAKKEYIQDYRRDRTNILSLVQTYYAKTSNTAEVQSICQQLEQQLRPLAARYLQLEREGRLSVPLKHLLHSLVHMHCNRLLGPDRDQEQRVRYYLQHALTDLPHWQPPQQKLSS